MSKNNKKELEVLIVGSSSNEYTTWLEKEFEVSANIVTKTEDLHNLKKKPELIVFTGGSDVNPNYYTEDLGKFTGIDKLRDELDFAVLNFFNKSIPKVGICRGSQFLCVNAGGSLIQHTTGHTTDHSVMCSDDNVINMTSTHHQMMYPFDVKHDLLAWSNKYRSDTYLNGLNQEIDLPLTFLEPEIVYFPSINSLAIQGHPEFENCNKNASQHCLYLIKNLLKNNFNN
jgi:anthranilate/para-aminobenzoate synthase component II